MGTCCGGTKNIQYNYNGKNHLIRSDQAETLDRFSQGANARIQTNKMKIELAKEIADLKKPSFNNDSTETLLSQKEFELYMDDKQKSFSWNNYFTDVAQDKQYRGEWSQERKVWGGIGELKFNDGQLYQGQIQNKLFNGKGRLTMPNGDIYQGSWVNGQKQGKGLYYYAKSQQIYDGDWQNDKKHGSGTLQTKNGSVYVGEFVLDEKNGKGKFTSEGGIYEGDFVNGKYNGQGKLLFANEGQMYIGSFKDNLMHGQGQMVMPDNSRFRGEWKEGKMSGQGTKVYANGDRYIGQIDNYEPHGTGVWFNIKDQTKRQGEWQNGKRVAWISTPQESHITMEEGPLDAELPTTQVKGKNYRGAKWREDNDELFKTKLDNFKDIKNATLKQQNKQDINQKIKAI